MPVYRLDKNNISFPNPRLARSDGLLAVGGDLCIERLLLAYTHGIFPGIIRGMRLCGGVPKKGLSLSLKRYIFPVL